MNDKRILIVDDDSPTRDMLARLLHASGYGTLTAVDGSQAVSIARHERPDLILLDLIYPPDVGSGGGVAWDGFLIMDWLHRLEEAKDIPVFVMTMGNPEKYRNSAFAKGAAAFFHKPINDEELLRRPSHNFHRAGLIWDRSGILMQLQGTTWGSP
jgi:CheY-like chemotaxis protein